MTIVNRVFKNTIALFLVRITNPLVSFVLSLLILGESITPAKVLGILLVLSGVWFLKG